MKKAVYLAMALLASLASAAAQSSDPTTGTDIARLIASLPTRKEMAHDLDTAVHGTNSDQKEARAHLAKARIDYNHLYDLLHVGASVFDYPGLLALTRTAPSGDGPYKILLGIPTRLHESGDPPHCYFFVTFDKTGIIIRVQSLLNPFGNI